MKNVIQLFLAIILFNLISCNGAKTEKAIKMYTSTWDHIINDDNIDLINNTNFTDDITLVSSPENIVGIEAFKG